MAEFLHDLNIHGAGQIQFKTTAGANAGKIDQSGDDLVLSNAVGDIIIGNGSDDVYIGDGTNAVDIRFEQNMAIYADSASTRTLTLGGANTSLVLESPTINGTMTLGATTINNKLTFTTASGYILFDYETSDTGEYGTEAALLKIDRGGTEKTILSRVSKEGGIALGADDTVAILAGDVKSVIKANLNLVNENVIIASESGFHAFGFPNNDTTWSNRQEFRFYTGGTDTSSNGLWIGDGGNTQFIDLDRNLKNIGTISSGAITSTGNITATASNATISAAESGGATTKIMGASVGRVGTSSNHNLEILSNNTAAITIDTSQNATFAGNITFGDSHFIGDDSFDNLHILASSGENVVIEVPSGNSIDLKTAGGSTLNLDSSQNATFGGDILVNTTTSGGYIQIDHSDDSLKLADANKIKLGTGNDLQIYHNGTDSYIDDAGTGDLRIRSNFLKIEKYTGETMATFNDDNAVTLYYDNSVRFETGSAGAQVTGNFYLFSGNYIHFDNGVTNDYAIRKISTTLQFKTGGTYDFQSGNAIFAGDIVPSADSTYDIGSNANKWAEGHFDHIYIGETGNYPRIDIYTEDSTTNIADSFADTTTDKSYIYFQAGSSSNDPGYIMHETSDSETNEAVLHLVPSDDNSTGDYVSIHGTNDPDVLKLHTSGLIETVNLQLQLKSGLNAVYINDELTTTGHITTTADGTYNIGSDGSRFATGYFDGVAVTNTLTAGGLDINGDGDISGNLNITGNITNANWQGDVISAAKGGTGLTSISTLLNTNAFANFTSTSGDYDNFTRGLQRAQGGSNGPSGSSHSTGFTLLQDDGNYGFQLFSIGSGDNTEKLFYRYKGTSYENWQTIVTKTYADNRYGKIASPTFTGTVTVPDLTVTGNLSITGDINSYNVTDLDVVDKTITIGKGQTEANSGGSGIIVDGSNASILWDESNSSWDFNKYIVVPKIVIGSDEDSWIEDVGDSTMQFVVGNVLSAQLQSGGNLILPGTISATSGTFTGNVTIDKNTPVLTLGEINNTTGNAKIQLYSKNNNTSNGFAIQYNKNTSIDRLEFIDGGGTAAFQFHNGGNATFEGDITANGTVLTGDQDLSGYALTSHNHDDRYYTETESDNRFVNVTGDTMTGSLTLGSDTNEKDFKVYGNDTGELLQWLGSQSKLRINHDTDDAGLEIYTVASAQPTSHQIKIGRDSGQYLGIRVDDGRSYFIHRQDESGGTDNHHQTNQIWTDGGGTHTWNWDIADSSGSSPSNKMQLNSSGALSLAGNLTASSGTFSGDVTIAKSTPKLTFNNLASGGLDPILTASGTDFTISTTSITPLTIALDTGAATFQNDVQAAGLYVGSTNTSYDFYNNGTSYLNGATTVDDNLTVNGNIIVTGTVDGVDISGLPTFSTVGTAFAQLGDVSVASYIRVNADETLAYLNASQFLNAIGGLSLGGGTMTGNIRLNDNVQLQIGSSNDAYITHNGSNTYFVNGVGNLEITNDTDGGDIIFKSDDGSGGTAEYLRLDGGVGYMIASKALRFLDTMNVQLGDSADFTMQHNATNTELVNVTGNLNIKNSATDGDISFYGDDGAGGVTIYMSVDGAEEQVRFFKPTEHGDGVLARFGDSGDLRIYHDGTDSYIHDNGTGDLRVRTNRFVLNNAADTENLIRAEQNSSVELFYNNSKKFETTSTGVNISGHAVNSSNGRLTISGEFDVTSNIVNRNIPCLFNSNFQDGTGTGINVVPFNSLSEAAVSTATYYHFLTMPYAGKLKRVVLKNVSGSLGSGFTTQLFFYVNGSQQASSSELSISTDRITWTPTSNNTFSAGDEISFAYQKSHSGTGITWAGVSFGVAIELTDYDI